MFTKGFGDGNGYVCDGDTIETEEGPFRYVARIEYDHDSHIDDDDMHHTDPDSETFEGAPEGEYERTQEARAAWERNEWFYAGVVVAVYVGDVCLDKHAASLWSIAANYPRGAGYDNGYLTEVANELLAEARDVAQEARKALVEKLG